jgi:hypothetical protein
MAFDRGLAGGVAWLTLILACGPTVKPASPPAEPEPVVQGHRPIQVAPGARRVVVGEMCLQGAGGRPAISPMFMRGVGWTDTASEVAATVERGSVPRFVVFGVDGKPAGTFDTIGLVDIGLGQSVASGAYVGGAPCTYAVDAKPKAGGAAVGTRGEDPACGPVTRGCGIAVGEVTHPDEPAETPMWPTGGACMAGKDLAVDIDGDGTIESFPIASVLDGIRAPAAEWSAAASSTTTCTPTFHLYNLQIAAEPRPGKPADKGLVTVDVLAVVDLDGDGRKELVLAMRFPTVRTIAIYTATSSPQRLELAGEAPAFAK